MLIFRTLPVFILLSLELEAVLVLAGFTFEIFWSCGHLKIRVVLSLSRVAWMLNLQCISHLQLLVEHGHMSDVCVLGNFCSWEASTEKVDPAPEACRACVLFSTSMHCSQWRSYGIFVMSNPTWLYFSVPLLVRLEHGQIPLKFKGLLNWF